MTELDAIYPPGVPRASPKEDWATQANLVLAEADEAFEDVGEEEAPAPFVGLEPGDEQAYSVPELIERVGPDEPGIAISYTFLPATEFLAREFPDPEPLLGARGHRFLAAGSFLLVYGEAGAAKTTWTIDGVAHLASSQMWLGLDVPRAVRFLVIENEGAPGLLQEAVADKAASWEGEPEWLTNVFFFDNPWGQFSFASAAARAELRDYCIDERIDVVVANPLLGLGASGAGRPEETAAFVEALKECGLWRDLGFWLVHHENKAGQVSGDWARHPDTVVLLERDGNRPRTKLTWTKTRHASVGTEKQPRTLLLEWLVESKSYTVVDADTTRVPDQELLERIDAYLTEHPVVATKVVHAEVQGDNTRISELLKAGAESGRYTFEKGPKNANLWRMGAESSEASLLGAPESTESELEWK